MEYNVKDLASEIRPDELPFPYSLIAAKINIETALELAQFFQGSAYYFPKLDDLMQKKRNEKIRQEYDGYNLKELAIKYNLTDRWIREIVGTEDENQIRMEGLI